MAIIRLSRTGWTITASSVFSSPTYNASNAIDSNTGTFWHSGSGYPHDLTVDMGSAQTFSVVEFVPRSDGTRTDPAQVEVYVSDDGISWGSAVASATWVSTAATQSLSFTAVTKRWFRFRGVTGANNAFLACTELYAGSPGPVSALVTQIAVESVVSSATAAARITQVAVESLAGTGARVTQVVVESLATGAVTTSLVTQVAVESLAGAAITSARTTQVAVESLSTAETPNEWVVEAIPRVRWEGIADDPLHLRGAWTVRSIPRVEWSGTVTDSANGWIVRPKPRVIWGTGPGTASTECISGDGIVPPPDEAPVESGEQNYVF